MSFEQIGPLHAPTQWTRGLLYSLAFALVLGHGASVRAVAQDSGGQETGAVTGVVVEAETGEPLPGANVSIQGTATGTSTDLNGRYRLKGLAPGTYDLLFSFVGFQQKTVTGVKVTVGQATELDVTLAEKTAQLGEVVVEARAARDSEAGLLKEREAAPVVSNAISADLMSKSGASTAADAMKKVTGASVKDGKYVFIRGLGDRYTTAQLNGIGLPTAAAHRNAVQFDLFSANLLDNLVVKKTFTPDQPGNFAGGLININTESYPADLTYKFSASTSVGTQTHFTDDVVSHTGGDLDFLALDDGTRSIPGPLKTLSADQLREGLRSTVRDEFRTRGQSEAGALLNRASKSFNDIMGPTHGRAPLNQSYSFGLGNEVSFFGRPLGVLLNVNYGYSTSYYEGFQGRYRGPIGGGSDQLGTELLLDEENGTTNVKMGGLLSLNYQVSQHNELGANVLYSRRGQSETQARSGRWVEQFGADSTVFFQDRNLFYTQRELYSVQLRGQHLLPRLGNTTVEWTAGLSDTRQDEPDTRLFGNLMRTEIQDGRVVDTSYTANVSGFPEPSRFFRTLSEDSRSARLDVSVPLGTGGESTVKVGAYYKDDDRSFDEREFEFSTSEEIDFGGNPQAYFSDENMGIVDTVSFREGALVLPLFGNTVFEETEAEDEYQGARTVVAGYAMVDVRVTDRLRVVGGARVEQTDIQITSEALNEDTGGVGLPGADTSSAPGAIEITDVLPSLNVVYNLRDDMNLRAAATRTLARPTFREIAPFSREDNVLGEIVIGNPSLDRSLITNLDLRWEWFPSPGEVVAASAFGKDIQDAIEVFLLPSTNGQRTWANTDARVYGAEFELRTQLDWAADPLRHVSVGTNFALIHSEAETPGSSEETRPLQGQSPYTFNFDVSYDNPETGTSAGLFFNTFGERLEALGVFQKPDVFEKPFHQLNFTFSQRVLNHWTVDVSVDNVLGDTARKVVPFRGNEFIYQRTPEGRSFSLGLSYEL